eukprot:7860511-Pyramimonas_sp.AAC.1
MRQQWDHRYDAQHDPELLHHLSLLLFKKRKSVEPADGDSAGAPQPGSAGAPQPGSDYDAAF